MNASPPKLKRIHYTASQEEDRVWGNYYKFGERLIPYWTFCIFGNSALRDKQRFFFTFGRH